MKETEKKYKNVFNKDLMSQYSPSSYYFESNMIRNAVAAFDVFPKYNYENLIIYDKQYFTRDNYLVENKTIDNYPSGSISNTMQNHYHSTVSGGSPLYTGSTITDNLGNVQTRNITYVDDRYSALINANLLNTIVEETVQNNYNTVTSTYVNYDTDSILPAGTDRGSLKGNKKQEFIFQQYDNKGNLISYQDSNGIHTTILYGYNQTLPIAIIKGVNYNTLAQDLYLPSNESSEYLELEIVKKSNLDIDENSENLLITELENFRKKLYYRENIYQITTYTYDTLIGVTNVISPSGMRQRYIYDKLTNQLEKVIDMDGNILTEYKYNYKH
ncbi:MAG TPA: hypothetical protein DEB37_11670 [Lysinibacillus sp.]|nr:hypothetical protein [Lysinibacillus sp.]